ncbi:hypothetical protein HY637_02300 [Candidatus Woesearchaeota archaeon]|nr:hypothetical protein [Candidatus Woesearchaeota archaeon]
MATKIIKDRKLYFRCDECSFLYENKNLAEKCEEYCKKYHACSTEITKHAIDI